MICGGGDQDIYCIEDLGEVIEDLKNGNKEGDIGVKLVCKRGVRSIG